jgi:hypothetical protein
MRAKLRIRQGGLTALGAIAVVWAAAMIQAAVPHLNWPDRRPVGALFLASNAHVSAKNPRGWFNDPQLDVTGPGGEERFCRALLAYADRSVAVLRASGAQGAIVWDIEGQQYPHKTTYIGDPRLTGRLAPEMDGCADEFFARFREASIRTGVTIRPQQIEFSAGGVPRQTRVWNYGALLLDKIDYARRRWAATLFYVDSNGGVLWPFEAFHLRRIAAARPDILLIPEYQQPLYYGFSAPYDDIRRGQAGTPDWIRFLYRGAFTVLNVADAGAGDREIVEKAMSRGDIVLFPAWFCGTDCSLIRKAQNQ